MNPERKPSDERFEKNHIPEDEFTVITEVEHVTGTIKEHLKDCIKNLAPSVIIDLKQQAIKAKKKMNFAARMDAEEDNGLFTLCFEIYAELFDPIKHQFIEQEHPHKIENVGLLQVENELYKRAENLIDQITFILDDNIKILREKGIKYQVSASREIFKVTNTNHLIFMTIAMFEHRPKKLAIPKYLSALYQPRKKETVRNIAIKN